MSLTTNSQNVEGLTRTTSSTPVMYKVTASGVSDPMPNGTQSIFTINVPGVTSTNLVAINVTNAGTFPTNVFVVQETLIANDTVEIVLENQSGTNVGPVTVEIEVITT